MCRVGGALVCAWIVHFYLCSLVIIEKANSTKVFRLRAVAINILVLFTDIGSV